MPDLQNRRRPFKDIVLGAADLSKMLKEKWSGAGAASASSVLFETGDIEAFTIAGEGGGRVVMTQRRMICLRCGVECYMLVFHAGWGCRLCSGCEE